ncbi:hypothetical protein GIB67_016344 [Kingdonia uniflora]|uniref:Uncharacterized protein n=1 Tax=Kingdonia uniflora TaxID=39325 RepID=A0A7J7M9K8_9MAGN|nr:hypothetical protein GIB67_016344 [Kingdonia uniflora]
MIVYTSARYNLLKKGLYPNAFTSLHFKYLKNSLHKIRLLNDHKEGESLEKEKGESNVGLQSSLSEHPKVLDPLKENRVGRPKETRYKSATENIVTGSTNKKAKQVIQAYNVVSEEGILSIDLVISKRAVQRSSTSLPKENHNLWPALVFNNLPLTSWVGNPVPKRAIWTGSSKGTEAL